MTDEERLIFECLYYLFLGWFLPWFAWWFGNPRFPSGGLNHPWLYRLRQTKIVIPRLRIPTGTLRRLRDHYTLWREMRMLGVKR